jgi:DNA-binding transcriptional ArsR family regulator
MPGCAKQPMNEKKPPIENLYHKMDDFFFSSIEQFEAFEDPLRFEMVRLLSQKPLTGAQIGRALGLPRHRVYYHINLLEKHKIIVQVGERVTGGVVEKYYCAAARVYHDDVFVQSLRDQAGKDEEARKTTRALRLLLAAQMKSIGKAMERLDVEAEVNAPSFNWDYTARLSTEQADLITEKMKEVLAELKKMDRDEPGAKYLYRGISALVRIEEPGDE